MSLFKYVNICDVLQEKVTSQNVDVKNQPLSLCSHIETIEALCFGNNEDRLLLASACAKSIVIWKIYEGLQNEQFRSVQVGKNLGNVKYMTFSPDDSYVAACIYDEVWIIDVQTSSLEVTLTGHFGNVIAGEFCIVEPVHFVTISEDKTFAIWSIEEKCMLFQSGIISASAPFLSLAMNPVDMFFACGTSDGMEKGTSQDVDVKNQLHVYDMTLHNSVHQVDLGNLAIKRRNDDLEEAEARGYPILTLKYWAKSEPDSQDKSYVVSTVLKEEMYLAVGCASCLMLLNANSLDIVWLIPFTDVSPNDPSCHFSSASRVVVSVVEDDDGEERLLCCALNLFSNDIHVLKIDHKEEALSSGISVLSLEPLSADSPLKSELKPKTKDGPKKITKGKPKKIDKMNQPIVFKQRVRSSGYTKDPPRKKMFQPKTSASKKKIEQKTIGKTVGPWGLKSDARQTAEEYPMDSKPPSSLDKDILLSPSGMPINDLNFSGTGKSLVCALADQTALMVKLPKMENPYPYIGHNGPVMTAIMGHSNNLLLTSGVDQTVKVWNPTINEPILNITTTRHNFKEQNGTQTSKKDNVPFIKSISGARFYYVDKFIMLAHGSRLCLYKYHLDEAKNDLKREEELHKTLTTKIRYQTLNRYKVVHEFDVSEAQSINAFSAINSFHSYLTICACSNRSIVIYDVNKAQSVGTIQDAHKKPIHSICQNQGSSYVSHSSEAYDLFITAAPTDGVKLWDLRVNRCVRKFEGHVNRAQNVGLAYSPCAQYIAVGSEDRSVYYYDIRSSSYVERLTGHSDVVTSLTFHPQKPLLVSGTLTGKMRSYKV